jgi:iron complex transport system permease protein
VSPDILGASTGAGFGAVFALIMSWSPIFVQLSAFIFGMLSVVLVYQISRLMRQSDPVLTLVLTGLLIGTIFSSLISVMKYIADPYDKLPSITYWLMGSLSTISMSDVKFAVLPVLFGLLPLILLRWKLNVMSFGEEEAMALGVNTKRIRFVVIFCATIMTAAVVSISGIIGWVGLLIPHFVRSFVGPNYQLLLPASILVGGTYLVWVDTFSRTLLPLEIPLGILTSLIGAPFFLYLLIHSRRGWQ